MIRLRSQITRHVLTLLSPISVKRYRYAGMTYAAEECTFSFHRETV